MADTGSRKKGIEVEYTYIH